MAFTTWQALKTSILDDIASGSVLTKSYGIANRSQTFRDMGDVISFLKFCDEQILAEETQDRRGPVVRGATPT
jgi:gamma-glutamylcysteine synthetase